MPPECRSQEFGRRFSAEWNLFSAFRCSANRISNSTQSERSVVLPASITRGHILMKIIIILFLLLCPAVSRAQVYSARTDTIPQPYPSPVPCPGSSCSGGGALTGANTIITPSDFNLPITRITDQNTGVNLGGAAHFAFLVNCGGSAETNFMNRLDNRMTMCDGGSAEHVFIWNVASKTATESYLLTTNASSLFWSFTQNYVAYDVEWCGVGSNDVCIESYDFTTAASPTKTQLVDLSSTCGITTAHGDYTDDVSVSQDDQTFGTVLSTTAGQGSSRVVYAIAWNRTNGCRVFNTSTASMSGSWGSTGSASLNDTYSIHNVRVSPGGTWMRVGPSTCTGGGCTSAVGTYTWQIATTNVYRTMVVDSSNGCGHEALGYSKMINQCAGGGLDQAFWIRPNNVNDGSGTLLPASNPPNHGSGFDNHMSWPNDNSTDTNPFCTSTVYNSQFAPVFAWDHEILCVATSGSGLVWRFAHTYATEKSQFFAPANAIGALSQDGKWFAWASDWDGMLGSTSGSASCTIGADCRADVFIMQLPIGSPPTNLKLTVH